ncbi:hypothetical protein IG617_01525 [Labrenzia polysiphoniae]|uniref:Uncharacterized protein n=1 Tax=Roseibium polysiphoniae TaxID=2571221 RepID=A0ABR9C627_9HYPH|nr:hypothetical protein [Roseibium polysiphoniae]
MLDLDFFPRKLFKSNLIFNYDYGFYHTNEGRKHLNCGFYYFKGDSLNHIWNKFNDNPSEFLECKSFEGSDQKVIRVLLADNAPEISNNQAIRSLNHLPRYRFVDREISAVSAHGAVNPYSFKSWRRYPLL